MQKKLTLRLDEILIQRAKSYSERTGKSVSQIVADYFALIVGDWREKSGEASENASGNPLIEVHELTPIVRSLKGSLKGTLIDESDYWRHIEDKYQ
jgi:hypothetical protein